MMLPGMEEGASAPGDVRTALSPFSHVTNCCGLFNMVSSCVRGMDPCLGAFGSASFQLKGQNASLVQW